MPWLVVRDAMGQPREASPCVRDCFARLDGLVRLRRTAGYTVVRLSAWNYRATSPVGVVEYLSIDGEAACPAAGKRSATADLRRSRRAAGVPIGSENG